MVPEVQGHSEDGLGDGAFGANGTTTRGGLCHGGAWAEHDCTVDRSRIHLCFGGWSDTRQFMLLLPLRPGRILPSAAWV